MPDVFYRFRVSGKSRTVSLTCHGSLVKSEGFHIGSDGFGDDPGSPGWVKQRSSQCVCVAPSPNPGLAPAVMQAYLSSSPRAMGWGAYADNGIGNTANDDQTLSSIAPPTDGTIFSNDCAYSMEWSATGVDTWCEIYFKDSEVAGADGDPLWLGPAKGDVNPRALGARYYEVVPVGSTVTSTLSVSAAAGSATATATGTNPSAWELNYAGGPDVQAIAATNQDGDTQSATGTAVLGGAWATAGPRTTVTGSESGIQAGSVTCTGPALTVVATHTGSISGPANSIEEGVLISEPARRFRVLGHAYALDKDHPGSLTLTVQGVPTGQTSTVTLSPSGTLNFDQRSYSVTWIKNGGASVVLDSASEADYVRSGISGGDGDADDWVTMFAGRSYPAMRMAHAAETPLPAPTEVSPGVWSYSF